MMRFRQSVLLVTSVLLLAGCRLKSDRGGDGDDSDGGGGGTRTTNCRLAGDWAGTLTVTEIEGVRLTPEMQAQLRTQMPPMGFSFTSTGAVTMTVGGQAMTFSRAGEEVIGGNPMNGVAASYTVVRLSASADRVELRLRESSGVAPADHRDDVRYASTGESDWTFTRSGDQLEVHCSGTKTSGGRTGRIVMVGTFTQAGGGGGGGSGGGW